MDWARLEARFACTRREAFDLRRAEQRGQGDPLRYWRTLKAEIDAEYGTEPLEIRWVLPDCGRFDPHADIQHTDDFHADGSVHNHFANQLLRIPHTEPPTPRKVIQMALNAGQALADGRESRVKTLADVVML